MRGDVAKALGMLFGAVVVILGISLVIFIMARAWGPTAWTPADYATDYTVQEIAQWDDCTSWRLVRTGYAPIYVTRCKTGSVGVAKSK